jgi:hypothetical protein
MSVRTAPHRVAQGVFAAAMVVSYSCLAIGVLGLADPKSASLAALAASIVGAVAALGFSLLWNREWRRSHHQQIAVTRRQGG